MDEFINEPDHSIAVNYDFFIVDYICLAEESITAGAQENYKESQINHPVVKVSALTLILCYFLQTDSFVQSIELVQSCPLA